MDQSSQKINVLVVGADGDLGSRIVECCLERPNLNVNVLCKETGSCPDLCARVTSKGGKCIKGDVTKPETLKGVCKDIHTVISTVEGDEKVILDGQQTLLREAIDSKVKRIVPSDFTIDYRNLKEDEHPTLRSKLRIRKMINDSPVKGLFIHCGMFMEKLFDIYSGGIAYWETMDQKIALTSIDDVARITAVAISDPNRTGDISIAGDQLTLREIVEIYNSTRNTKAQVIKMGNVEDLKKAIQTLRDKGDRDRSAILNYILLRIQGKAGLKDTTQLPDVKPINLEKFIKDHPDVRLGDTGVGQGVGMQKQQAGGIFSDLIPAGQQQQQQKVSGV